MNFRIAIIKNAGESSLGARVLLVCLVSFRPNSDPAYLFEQMCSERISPYGGDGDSDEDDAWEEKEIVFAPTNPRTR